MYIRKRFLSILHSEGIIQIIVSMCMAHINNSNFTAKFPHTTLEKFVSTWYCSLLQTARDIKDSDKAAGEQPQALASSMFLGPSPTNTTYWTMLMRLLAILHSEAVVTACRF